MFGITVFGDSITFGRGDAQQGGWCGRLKKRFESEDYYTCLHNLGICGNTSVDVLSRFESEANARISFSRNDDRHVIIFAIGLNDSRIINKEQRPQTQEDSFEEIMRTLLDKAAGFTQEIICIGLTAVNESRTHPYEDTCFLNERIARYDGIIKDLCQERGVPFIEVFSIFSGDDGTYLLSDGVHPNAEGYARMYERIEAFLIEQGILARVKSV